MKLLDRLFGIDKPTKLPALPPGQQYQPITISSYRDFGDFLSVIFIVEKSWPGAFDAAKQSLSDCNARLIAEREAITIKTCAHQWGDWELTGDDKRPHEEVRECKECGDFEYRDKNEEREIVEEARATGG